MRSLSAFSWVASRRTATPACASCHTTEATQAATAGVQDYQRVRIGSTLDSRIVEARPVAVELLVVGAFPGPEVQVPVGLAGDRGSEQSTRRGLLAVVESSGSRTQRSRR